MKDEEFLSLFEKCNFPKEQFKHKEHLRVAWLYLSKYTFDQAMKHITQGIMRYSESVGAAHIYHETLTRVWVFLVNNDLYPKATSFEKFISKNPHLLDKTLPLQYFSKTRLDSEQARKQWIAPDIKRLIE